MSVRNCWWGVAVLCAIATRVNSSNMLAAHAVADKKPLQVAIVEHFLARDSFVCIGLDDRKQTEVLRSPKPRDPGPDLMEQLQRRSLSIEPASVCRYDYDKERIVVRGNQQSHGAIITIGEIRFQGTSRAEADIVYCCWIGWGVAELELVDGNWRVARLKDWLQS